MAKYDEMCAMCSGDGCEPLDGRGQRQVCKSCNGVGRLLTQDGIEFVAFLNRWKSTLFPQEDE